ncbi:hypothetical protein AJ78_00943 [Emergomyces pasteurianus Ep9510]|uniref:Rhodopsin domain-containing protein n=1 Tax=Emergomyces pasteurianus Ep9510 TaxID=1447872 RepID=A0A1J9PS58_9EURO|nr:hypothetical protein AJ78_00943 [Emergomyces pasteurianus Ep9510]
MSACVHRKCTIKEGLITLNVTRTECGSPIRDQTATSIWLPAVGIAVFVPMIVLRIYTHIAVVKSGLTWDDWATLLLGICVVPLNVGSILLGKAGLGKDIWTIEFQKINEILLIFLIQEHLYIFCISLTKIAFLLFYVKIFPFSRMLWVIKAAGVVTLCYAITFLFAFGFQCRPVSYNWNGWDGEHKGGCTQRNDLVIAAGAINVVLDAWVIALPIPCLMGLQMSLPRKIEVISMFSLGFLITGVSIYRVVMLKVFATSSNPTWDNAAGGFWSIVEVDVGVCCLCIPAMRSLLGHYLPTVFGTRKRDEGRTTTGAQSITQKSKQEGLDSHSSNSFIQLIDLDKGSRKDYEDEH